MEDISVYCIHVINNNNFSLTICVTFCNYDFYKLRRYDRRKKNRKNIMVNKCLSLHVFRLDSIEKRESTRSILEIRKRNLTLLVTEKVNNTC